MWETWVLSLSGKDPLKKGKAAHSSILAWRILWTVDSPWTHKESDTTEWLSLSLFTFYLTTGKTISLIIQTFVGKVMSLLFNMLSRFVIAFIPRSNHLLKNFRIFKKYFFINYLKCNKAFDNKGFKMLKNLIINALLCLSILIKLCMTYLHSSVNKHSVHRRS